MFQPELLEALKGKSRFHIRTLDRTMLRQIKDALAVGVALYRKRGRVASPTLSTSRVATP